MKDVPSVRVALDFEQEGHMPVITYTDRDPKVAGPRRGLFFRFSEPMLKRRRGRLEFEKVVGKKRKERS
jgi:hypothetical protein